MPSAGLPPLTAEVRARATFEGAAAAVRWFLVARWRAGLTLRLGRPRASRSTYWADPSPT
ncbi:hypothetical protein [Streptomyces beihaiensis]|uniref:Uncharacterized protein n=1 Tax=Streptomyces beihaiensis TaxID=2984495 RepID=A0ABT3U188_9ACTN|nr:hypothetical protein [Streptomyces beihaiensis]MCX3063029.1 hypothetical protein [Streptomyces beihaiensis]